MDYWGKVMLRGCNLGEVIRLKSKDMEFFYSFCDWYFLLIYSNYYKKKYKLVK